MWKASEAFTGKLLACQMGLTGYGMNPQKHSFLEFRSEGLHVSAVKRSENGRGWAVRIFNPSDRTVENAIRLNGGFAAPASSPSPMERLQAEFQLPAAAGLQFSAVQLATLEEVPL